MTTKLKFRFDELDHRIQRGLIHGYWKDTEIRSWDKGTRFPCEISAKETIRKVVEKFLAETKGAGIKYDADNVDYDNNHGLLTYNGSALTRIRGMREGKFSNERELFSRMEVPKVWE